jgi:DNA-binding phage protein
MSPNEIRESTGYSILRISNESGLTRGALYRAMRGQPELKKLRGVLQRCLNEGWKGERLIKELRRRR